jgi:hypothetical protein
MIGFLPESVVQNRLSSFSPAAWAFHFWMEGRSVSEIVLKRSQFEKRGWTYDTFQLFRRFESMKASEAFAFARKLRISKTRLASILGLKSEAFHCAPGVLLEPDAKDALLRLADIWNLAYNQLGNEPAVAQWFRTNNQSIQGMKPMHLLKSRDFSLRLLRIPLFCRRPI